MLTDISHYTYGTIAPGKDVHRIREDMKLIRQAMEAEVWFHVCRNYGSMANYNLLGKAFAEASRQTPRVIAKIRCYNAAILRYDVEDTCTMLGKEQVEIAQLSMRAGQSKRGVVDDFIQGGPISEACAALKEEGRIGSLVLEVFFGTSDETLDALAHDCFDGYTFYYSILQREASNEVFEGLRAASKPVLALCAAAGGCAAPSWYPRRKAEAPEDRQVRIYEQIRDLIAEYEVRSWQDLLYGFLNAQENVVTAIAGTTSPEHLVENLRVAANPPAVPSELVARILAIHSDWMGRA